MVLHALLTLACLSCTDRNPNAPDARVAMEVTPVLRCTVDVRSETVSCTEEGPARANGPAYALLGNASVKLRSANNSYDSLSLVYGFNVTVQNLLSYSIGTPDGQKRAGLKVFFETGPNVTAYKAPGDTGSVTLENPDGVQDFTAANQQYFFYDTILGAQQISNPKRWEMIVPRTVDRFGFTVRVFTATPRERPVPMQAPEGRPRWFYAAENSRPCTGLMAGPCLPNVVTIQFTASSSQEERQAAIDLVGGTVVGGTLGMYHVQIPQDTTMTRLRSVIRQLRALPQAQHVAPFSTAIGTVDYLRPADGAGFTRWQMNPDSADSENWALEQIAAPLAWGCSVGDDATRLGVVDDGFFSVGDIDRQTRTSSRGYPSAGSTLDDHGTRVTAVAAAYGNDTSMVTGVMWRANLILRDAARDSAGARFVPVGLPINEMWSHIRVAGRAGSRVINISLGWRWNTNPATETDTIKRLDNQALLADWFRNFKLSMDSLAAEGHRPLIVFSAGNQGGMGVDASWNVGRIAADSSDQFGQPYTVLVVGASTRAQALASFTNSGPLVSVAAPGASVVVLHGNARVDSVDPGRSSPYYPSTGSGTSFAAPHVTGVAGLLFSFDPRLTAFDVKRLVIDGAIRGHRTAGGIPILNAHESLILAARRTGAPLCGNRVWAAGGRLYAQRDTASATGEELFGFTPDTLERSRGFNALHGGKRIMLYTQQPQALRRGREWSPSGWTLIPFAPSSSGLANASFLSGKGLSHEGDTLVFLQQTVSAPTVTYRPAFEVGSTTTPFTAVITDSAYAGPPVCVATFVEVPAAQHDAWSGDPAYQSWMQQYGMPGACVSEGEPEVKVETSRHLAYAPVGQQAYAFINRTRTTTQVTDGRLCTRAQGLPTYVGAVFFYKANCLSSLSVATTAGMTGYRLDVPRRRIHAVSWRDSTAAFWYPQIDETGRELLVERVTQRSEVRWYWQDDINGTAQYTQAPATSTEGCSLQFRDLATGAVRLAPGICGATGAGGYSAVRTRS